MEGNRWPTLILLTILAVASGVLVLRIDDKPAEAKRKIELGLGYYMEQAELIGTGDDGRIVYRITTDEAVQNVSDGTIDLQPVRINYEATAEIPWDLSADTGQILPDANIMRLAGNVVAKTHDEANEPITIRTEFLQLNTESYIANTDHKVSVKYTANKLFASGLRAYLKDERVQLISDVNGQFFP